MCPCSFRTRYRVGVFLNRNCVRLYHSGIINVGEGDFTLLFIIKVYTVSLLTILFNYELQNQR